MQGEGCRGKDLGEGAEIGYRKRRCRRRGYRGGVQGERIKGRRCRGKLWWYKKRGAGEGVQGVGGGCRRRGCKGRGEEGVGTGRRGEGGRAGEQGVVECREVSGGTGEGQCQAPGAAGSLGALQPQALAALGRVQASVWGRPCGLTLTKGGLRDCLGLGGCCNPCWHSALT